MSVKKYDCVVIGSGVSGIVAALKSAHKGLTTLLIEKQNTPGGYFSGFKNEEGDKFDYAISYVLSCGSGDVVDTFLKDVGLEERIKFKKLEATDDIYIGNRHFQIQKGQKEFKELLLNEFPESAQEIENLVSWLSDYLQGTASQGSNAMMFFMKNFRRDYEEFIKSYISDDLLRDILSLRIQADPSSLMIMAGFIVECYFNGMYYPVGGSDYFVKSLIDRFEELGGELITDTEIVSLATEGQRVLAAVDANGNEYEADTFIYNGDVIKLYEKLVPELISDKTKEKARKRVRGHSSLSMYLTVKDYDLSRFKGGRVYFTLGRDIFEIYRNIEADKEPEHTVIKLHFPCTHDATLAKDGRQLIRIETDMYYDELKDTEEKYLSYADKLLKEVEDNLLNGISEKIVYKRVITPVEYAAMFGHTGGSGTGWAHTTYNMMVSKYGQKTELGNLFIAGQWGEYGSGLRQLVLSGEKAFEMAMKAETKKQEVMC